jgi:predicted metal-dependent hydrolase
MSDHLQQGIFFFNQGRYFEAHEAWEDMWRSSGGPLRWFYQGLVQAAVGMHHLAQGNRNGATAQLEKALSKLENYPGQFCGINNEKLIGDLRNVSAQMTLEPIQIEKL